MNETERNNVGLLLNKLIEKPAMKLISGEEDAEKTFSINKVKENFENNLYSSLFDFVIDIRCLIVDAEEKYNGKEDELAIILQFSNWFEKKIQKIPHSEVEEMNKIVKKETKKLRYVFQAMALYPEEKQSKETPEMPSPAEIKEVQNLLINIIDINVMRNVIKIFKRHGVNLIPGKNLSIPASHITKDCLVEIRNLLK